jgi:hypothetical protein
MDTTVEAPVVRQVQSTDYYCGAACAVMMLTRKDRVLTQDAAYAFIRKGNAEPDSFYTDPVGFEACLDGILSGMQFEDIPSDDKNSIVGLCLSTLSNDKRPVPILVKQGNHWVLIDGMVSDMDSSGISSVKTVAVVDPWPQATNRSWIPADVFERDYLTPVKYGVKWKDKLVIVRQKGAAAPHATSAAEQIVMGGGAKVDEALVARHLEAVGLPQVKPAIGGGIEFTTVTVNDLTQKPQSQYTIFALDGSNSQIFKDFVLVAADSSDGRILEAAQFVPRFNYFSEPEARALVASQVSDAGTVSIDPDYFFFESRKLRSRLMVARRVTIGGVEHWLMPDGVLMPSRDEPVQGGQ